MLQCELFYKFKENEVKILKNIKISIVEIIACNIFPIIYGFIEISVFEIMLKTCRRIDIPPKPSKQLDNMIVVVYSLIGIVEIVFNPFVNSMKPERIPLANSWGMLNMFKRG